MTPILVRTRGDLSPAEGTQTAGMTRAQAALGVDTTAVEVRTQPGTMSGWHHHGNHETYGYVVSGRLRFEFGPGGGEVVEAGPGDFFRVPAHMIHREGNPAADEQVLVGLRTGSGPTAVNVDGPEGS